VIHRTGAARKGLFSRKSKKCAVRFGANARPKAVLSAIMRGNPAFPREQPHDAMPWFLYLIECSDGSIYTGIATDVDARFEKHSSGKGARYTRSRKPLAVLASFELAGRSEASRAEYWVKRLSAMEKRALIAGVRTLDSVVPAREADASPETPA
jgi:putative endonuclease